MGFHRRIARGWRAWQSILFIAVTVLGSSCGTSGTSTSASSLPAQYWLAHSYSTPAKTSRYFQWGARNEFAIGFTPSFYFVPPYFAEAYPPWLYQPNPNVFVDSYPSWYSPSYYWGAPNFGVPDWAYNIGWGGEIENGVAFGMPWANNPIWSPQYYGNPTYNNGQSGTVTAVTSFSLTVGSSSCSGANTIASINNCSSGTCSGVESACDTTQSFNDAPGSSTPAVFADFLVTATGLGIVGGPNCPANYTNVGQIEDCGNANGTSCSGNQDLCAAIVPPNALGIYTAYVSSIKFVIGQSTTVPSCPSGYEAKGSFFNGPGIAVAVCVDIQ
jgi:hypothetical protein